MEFLLGILVRLASTWSDMNCLTSSLTTFLLFFPLLARTGMSSSSYAP
jgi:hypothetical protein